MAETFCGQGIPKPRETWWMNDDQWSAIACPCVLRPDHDGTCKCDHDLNPQITAQGGPR